MENRSNGGNERKLLVFETVKASFLYMWRQRRELFLPLMVLLLVQLLTGGLLLGLLISGLSKLQFCALVPMWVVQLAFMVGMQRRLHWGSRSSGLRVFALDRTLLRSVLTLVEVVLCTTLVPGVIATFLVLVSVILFHPRHVVLVLTLVLLASLIIAIALLMRLILAVPAAALGQRDCLSLSWHAMAGNSLRVLCAGILINGPLVVGGGLLAWERLASVARFSPGTLPTVDRITVMYWLPWLSNSVLGTIGVMTTIVMLSIAYGSLVDGSPVSEETAVNRSDV
jgi:hypothetical protein